MQKIMKENKKNKKRTGKNLERTILVSLLPIPLHFLFFLFFLFSLLLHIFFSPCSSFRLWIFFLFSLSLLTFFFLSRLPLTSVPSHTCLSFFFFLIFIIYFILSLLDCFFRFLKLPHFDVCQKSKAQFTLPNLSSDIIERNVEWKLKSKKKLMQYYSSLNFPRVECDVTFKFPFNFSSNC